MVVPTVNRRTWRVLGPSLVFGGMLAAYIMYTSTLASDDTIRRLSSSGAYVMYQDTSHVRPDLVGRAAAPNTPLTPGVTIVTGFLPPNAHAKDIPNSGDPYTRWIEWSKLFRNMSNPVIAYLGSVQYMFYFESVRGRRAITDTNMTKVTLKDLDLYKLKPRIEQLLPTSNLGLTADQILNIHGKYELLLHAAKLNPFRTTHMIFLDPEDFTSAFANDHTYKVQPPENYDITRVAYRTFTQFERRSTDEVFKARAKYLEGDFIIGATETIKQWCEMYLQAFRTYLEKGYLGTEESTVYAMIVDTENKYRDMVNVYQAGEPGFAVWYQKMSGSRKPYSKR